SSTRRHTRSKRDWSSDVCSSDLISPSSFGNPRRMATGIDQTRVPLLMAVLEKRVGLMLQKQDAYIKVTGGVKLDEPAIDLAIAEIGSASGREGGSRAQHADDGRA